MVRGRPPCDSCAPDSTTMPSSNRSDTALVTVDGLRPERALISNRLIGASKYTYWKTFCRLSFRMLLAVWVVLLMSIKTLTITIADNIENNWMQHKVGKRKDPN